jgi:Icc-related predicted phosphoesterase
MKLVCISDTHSQHRKLSIPPGDVLIHAGDFTKSGKPEEIREFDAWLSTLPHPHKLVIAGNHDFLFERDPEKGQALLQHATYLEDTGTTIEGREFWGSPVSPRFFDWAFNRDRGDDIMRHWELIPDQVDVLITHTPPYQILDRVFYGGYVGCADLRREIEQRIRPRLVVFGHIHESYGQLTQGGTTYINASSLDRRYRPVNAPVVFEL